MTTQEQRRTRDLILYGCMIVCGILSGLTGVVAARHYAATATTQNAKLAEQAHATCVANRTFLRLLNQSVKRQRRSLKVDPPAKKKIDQAAIEQIQELIEGYGPAVEFCPERS